MSDTHPQVSAFIARQDRWGAELAALRDLLRQTALVEDLKWGKPCYTHKGANVAILYALRDTAALGFFKGVLLADPDGILIAPGENSQSSRWIRVDGVADIAARQGTLLAYVNAAIAVEDAGLKVAFPEKDALVYPAELTEALAQDTELAAAFDALTPGRRRGYNLFFTAPKQRATRVARIAKHRARILAGKGMHDR